MKSNMPRAPSILDILPMKMTTPATTRMPDIVEELDEDQDLENLENLENQHLKDIPEQNELSEDDSLQSVESEQIDSIYNTEGMYFDFPFSIAFGSFLCRLIQYILKNEFVVLCVPLQIFCLWIENK